MFTFARTVSVATVLAALTAIGCAETTPSDVQSPALRLALAAPSSAPSVRVVDLRVLHRTVNLMQPLAMEAAGNEVSVTFAMRQRQGIQLALDPVTLEARVAGPVTYPERPEGATPPYLDQKPVRVALAGGETMEVWTDTASGHVLAQSFDAQGVGRGEPVIVSLADESVLGAPRAVTSDGRRVIVTFFASRREGFELVAASLETGT